MQIQPARQSHSQTPMNELQQTLIGDSAATPARLILQAVADHLAHHRVPSAPHSIYEEVWHLAYWQDMTLDWAAGRETPVPEHASIGFPTPDHVAQEKWDQLRERFLIGTETASALAGDEEVLPRSIRCPSLPGKPTRTMSVREQLESLAAHNAYHLGRVVLLRQLNGAWPPPSGSFTW